MSAQSQILGLVTGQTFADKNFYNRTNRRRIFRDFPTGQFPLTGFLSLMETESCDSFKFGWFEKRLPNTTVLLGATPFTTAGGNVAIASPSNYVAGTVYRALVSSTQYLRPKQVVQFCDLPITGGASSLQGIVTSIVDGTRFEFVVVETVNNVINTGNDITAGTPGPLNAKVMIIGTANEENGRSGTGITYAPLDVENYTQIFRNPFNFSATALKIPTEFDKTGIYAEGAEDALRDHMVQMENAFLFGTKGVQTTTDAYGNSVPRRTTGGLLWFMRQWEAADSVYRGGAGAPAITLNTDDNKRIINITTGSITRSFFNQLIERAFRVTNTKTFEKLLMCGNGLLGAVNDYLAAKAVLNKDYAVQKVYGNDVTTWITPYGTLHLKTHPLFNQQDYLRYDGVIVDIQKLRFRPLNDRDTTLLPNRQDNDVDGRKDEWLTEAGLEVNQPEAFMWIKNLRTITDA